MHYVVLLSQLHCRLYICSICTNFSIQSFRAVDVLVQVPIVVGVLLVVAVAAADQDEVRQLRRELAAFAERDGRAIPTAALQAPGGGGGGGGGGVAARQATPLQLYEVAGRLLGCFVARAYCCSANRMMLRC